MPSPPRTPATDPSFGEATPARWSAALLALVFLALHLPYLPKSLEDLDSINFALGVRHFDVAHHQPHPPGYPVFILVAKALHAVVPAEATALALLSAIAAALGVLGLASLYRRLDENDVAGRWSAAAVGVAMTTPLYWFTAVRPISDSSGLAAAIGVQAMTLAASTARGLYLAGFCAGVAAGLRSQVAWLTVPLLALRAIQGLGAESWGLGARSAGTASEPVPPSPKRQAPSAKLLAPSTELLAPSTKLLVPVTAAFLAGIAAWLVPLVVVSGGPAAYAHALFDQGAEDLGNIQMLWTRHGVRDVMDALYYALVAPWAAWPVAAVALTCGFAGLLRLAATRRRTLTVLAAAFLPYFVFDLLFQETFTSRYALPLVVPMAYLAVAGLRLVPWDLGLAVAVALAMFCAHVGGTSIAAYSGVAAPAFRLLDTMGMVARLDRVTPVLAMDRRQSLDFRRPIAWIGDAMPTVARTLPSPPQHEWMEAVKYWNGGGAAPVWFVVDPLRASIDLVQHGAPLTFRWAVPYPVLLGGTRPNEMDWYRVDRPEWYVGEGWALTPEAAGVADADRRDPSRGPITGWVLGSASSGGTLMIGGRSFDPTLRPRLTMTLGGLPLIDDTLTPGAFLKFVSLPFSQRDSRAPAYDAVTVTTTAGARIAVEQFDASTTRPLMGFGEGWHEQEFNPMTGRRWRWLSRRGELRIVVEPFALPSNAIRLHPAGSLVLHLEGESPRTYFPRGSRLVVRSREQVAFDRVLSSDFSLDVPIENVADTIVLETDQSYVPAERSRRSQDRRQLGLRIFKAEIRRTARPAS